MDWLIDTNVISELVRPRPDGRVVSFLQRTSGLHLSVVTLHEIAYGADRAPDPVRRAKLTTWLGQLSQQFADRIIQIDVGIAEHAGRLRAAADALGRPADPLDALIAATALERNLKLATRDIADFRDLGPELHDPWT
ncbi:MAG: type II toxin-antitoxin system VapC family toxin [Dongiaceae bacterium]